MSVVLLAGVAGAALVAVVLVRLQARTEALVLRTQMAASESDSQAAAARVFEDVTGILDRIVRGASLPECLDAVVDLVERHTEGATCSLLALESDGSTRRHGTASVGEPMWSVPVVATETGRPLGTLALHHPTRVATTSEERRLLDLAALLAETAMRRTSVEARLAHQALHDPLTGLANRALLLDRLALALARAERRQSTVAVLSLDLDRFTLVNDGLGHDVGDRLLVEVAHRLRDVLRPTDTAARLGSDEFVVLCEDVEVAEVTTIAERLLEAVAQPLATVGELVVTASVGIAWAVGGRTTPEALLGDADAAAHRAKDKGRSRWEVFDDVHRSRTLDRLATEAALRRAIDSGELRIHYQPEISLSTNRIVGVEALVRWEHPERGLLAPAAFIALAEESGLIVPLGEWVLREACQQAAEWSRAIPAAADLTLAVNLSARQLDEPGTPAVVADALRRSGMHPSRLCLEITESVLMNDVASSTALLDQLKTLGVQLAVDDFGTGYSSLAYLKRFPVDILKVDRSFVERLGQDVEDTAIVGAVIDLARALGLSVIAEGVENTEQLAELRALGCHVAQGFHFARPAPAEDVAALLGLVAAPS